MFIPRPYQSEAIDVMLSLRSAAQLGVACESPTGTGKSAMMAMLAARLASEGRRVLILAHREELVVGNALGVEQVTGSKCWIELNTQHRMTYADWNELKSNGGVVSASVDTVQGRRLRAMPADLFTDIIVDEAHHIRPLSKKQFDHECKKCKGEGEVIVPGMDDDTVEDCPKCDGTGITRETGSKYYKVKAHFGNCFWYGFSGTFYRKGRIGGSHGNVMGKVFDQLHQTGTLFHFIDQGWLVDFQVDHMSAVEVLLDFSKLKTKHVSEQQAQEVWATHRLEALSALRQGLFEKCGQRPTLIFSPKVQHASWVAEFINSADTNIYPTMGPETADYVASYLLQDDGTRSEYPESRRRSIVDRMRAGNLPWVANQGVFTEGTDIPSIAAIALCRVTESVNLMRQIIGRGARTLKGVLDGLADATAAERLAAIAASQKPNCLLLDFAGVSQNRGVCDLATPTSVIQEEGWSDAQKEFARRFWSVAWQRGQRPTFREAKEEIEHASSEWMQGVRTMMAEVQEDAIWEVTRVDLRDASNNTQVAHRHNEANPDMATDRQINFAFKLCRDTGMFHYSKAEIQGMPRKRVSEIIGQCKPVRDAMAPPSWLAKQIRLAGRVVPATWGEAYQVLDGIKQHA